MKFSIRQSALQQLLQTVSKAVAVRTPKPVLTGILLELTEQSLVATAYDLELGIQDTLTPDEDNRLEILQPGAIVLTARFFSDVVRKLPGDVVHIQVSNNYMAEIRSGHAEFHLHGIDAAEFPKLPLFQRSQSIQIASDTLKNLIQKTAFAASTLEVRPVLTGIHLECDPNLIRFTATDALRLATSQVQHETPLQLDRWEAIIPSKSVNELARILPDDNRPITIQFKDSHSLFEVGSTLFYTRLIDGAYPDTNRIIPTQHKTEVVLQSDLLLGAIDRAALIARDREVRLEVNEKTLTISSSSPEIGNVSESLEATEKNGEDLLIAFNAKYVLDALKALSAEEVSIHFNGWNQPFVIREHNNPNSLQLISPVLMR